MNPTILRSEEHTSELQSRSELVCRLLLEKKNDAACRSSSEYDRTEHLWAGFQPAQHAACAGHQAACHRGYGGGDRRGLHRFFFNDTATTEIYTLSLHDALPI